MLQYLADSGEVPLHVLMAAFWPGDEPQLARPRAEKWAREQVAQGNLAISPRRSEAATTLRLSPKAARVFEPRVSPGAVGHPRARAHHAATLRFIEQVRRGLPPSQRIAEVLLEPQLRARMQAGRATRRGETFASFPDAALVIEETMPDGTVSRRDVALEYVTSKYTSKDIIDKAQSFGESYGETLWVADNVRTKRRVELLVGGACACLT